MKHRLSFSQLLALVLCVTLVGSFSTAPQAQPGADTTAIYEGYDFDNQTVSSTAIGLTSSKVLPTNAIAARQATCVVETNSVRIRYDGTDPTAAIGLLFTAGQTFSVYGSNNIRRLRAIRVTSDGALQCQLAR